jgi:hypothetical protein
LRGGGIENSPLPAERKAEIIPIEGNLYYRIISFIHLIRIIPA